MHAGLSIALLLAIPVSLGAPIAFAETASKERVRAFATLPDWRGIWELDNGTRRGLSGRTAGGVAELRARSLLAAPPPYNAEWEARYRAALNDREALASLAARSKSCTYGFPVIMESTRMFQIVPTPEETLIVFDDQEVRHIYTDGRGHPEGDDLWPTLMGDSIGRWEGETLVVDTVARIAGPIGFLAPVAHLSAQARFTERFRMLDRDHLENEMTIDDPITFTRPWRIKLRYKRVKDLDRMRPYDCVENERNPVVDGKLTVAPP